jgi:hypothetical protein
MPTATHTGNRENDDAGALVPAPSLRFDYGSLSGGQATEVARRTRTIRELSRRATEDIVRIGNELLAVKAALPRGRWGEWLEVEFGWSQDSAERFMRVALTYGANPQIAEYAPSALYLLTQASVPEDARREAAEQVSSGGRITHAAAKAIVTKHVPRNTSAKGRKPAAAKRGPARRVDPSDPLPDEDDEVLAKFAVENGVTPAEAVHCVAFTRAVELLDGCGVLSRSDALSGESGLTQEQVVEIGRAVERGDDVPKGLARLRERFVPKGTELSTTPVDEPRDAAREFYEGPNERIVSDAEWDQALRDEQLRKADDEIERHFAKLVRLIDARADARGLKGAPGHSVCIAAADQFLAAFRSWQRGDEPTVVDDSESSPTPPAHVPDDEEEVTWSA